VCFGLTFGRDAFATGFGFAAALFGFAAGFGLAAGFLGFAFDLVGAGFGFAAGFEPALRVGNGGLDANWLVRHGVPTVTFGAGQNAIHTTEEYVDLPAFLDGCRMALALATLDG